MINAETVCDIDNPIYEMRADKIKDFLSYEPNRVTTLQRHTFFECPIMGSDVGLVMLTPDCELWSTDLYDATRAEMIEVIEERRSCSRWEFV